MLYYLMARMGVGKEGPACRIITVAKRRQRPSLECRAIAASSVMSGISVIMGVGLWYTEAVAVHLFRQPDHVAKASLPPDIVLRCSNLTLLVTRVLHHQRSLLRSWRAHTAAG